MTGMTFLWPEMLLLLLVVPLLIGGYLWLLGRRRKSALRYASLSMVKDAIGAGPSWRRHLPPALFLLALTLMIVAIARPAAVVTLPSQHGTVILAMDVSGSMRAADVEPSRLEAAQAAARTFVQEQPRTTRIGVVSFAGTAAVVQSPTQSREDILQAIDRFQLQRGTAIGSGIIMSLATIFPDAGLDIGELMYGREYPRPSRRNAPLKQDKAEKKDFKPVPPGSYTSAVIVLLSDGQTTTGPDPIEAARMAADRGVRIFTVGIGTVNGATIGFGGWSMRVSLDEEALKEVAKMTRGEYFYAGNAPDLKKVYQSLNSRFVMEKKEAEITALFAAAAAVLAAISGLLSMVWFGRVL
jgi:Ca-activated chloride channel family protein